MQAASAALEFEQAAMLRDQMGALAKVLHQQTMEDTDHGDTDIIAIAASGGRVCVNLAMVRGGRHLGDRAFFPTHTDGDSLSDVLEVFIAQHYIDHPLPAAVVGSHVLPDPALIDLLAESRATKSRFLSRPQGMRRAWLEQALRNAEMALVNALSESGARSARTLASGRLPRSPLLITRSRASTEFSGAACAARASRASARPRATPSERAPS
jgi:excinuclease ABC subunit C